MTATLTFHQILPANLYNFFGGSVDLLGNSNIEYDLCGVGTGSYIYEVTPQSTPQTVWTMQSHGDQCSTVGFACRACIRACNGRGKGTTGGA